MRRIKRVNKLTFAVNKRMQKVVDDFLVTVEAENSDPETAMIREVTEGMNDLNLEGNNIITVNQIQSRLSGDSAANGYSN
ncbi:hypothetical protein CRYUN_Cryun09bG0206700 [Craigia yunnanensis]